MDNYDWLIQLKNFIYEDILSVVNHPMLLFEKLKTIQEKQRILKEIQKINQKLDETWMVKAHAGVSHLVDGLNSDIVNIKYSEFQMARKNFNELISLSDKEDIYLDLKAIGYWGNYNYFSLLGDYHNAALQIYKCTSKYPLISLVTFPKDIFDNFPTDYPQRLSELLHEVGNIHNDLHEKKNQLTEEKYKLMIGLGIGATAIAALLVTPWILPVGFSAVGNLIGKTVKVGSKSLTKQQEVLASLSHEVLIKNQNYQSNLNKIQQECHNRMNILSRIRLK